MHVGACARTCMRVRMCVYRRVRVASSAYFGWRNQPLHYSRPNLFRLKSSLLARSLVLSVFSSCLCPRLCSYCTNIAWLSLPRSLALVLTSTLILAFVVFASDCIQRSTYLRGPPICAMELAFYCQHGRMCRPCPLGSDLTCNVPYWLYGPLLT